MVGVTYPLIFLVLVGYAFAQQGEVSVSRTTTGGTFAPGDLIFEDNFDIFNTSLWQHEINMNGGSNNELQIYDDYPENSYVRDGVLYINPTLSLDTVFGGDIEQLFNGSLSLDGCTDETGGESCARQAAYPNINPPIVSARLRTKGAFAFTYGRVELRAKMPSADWTWPAIWLLPEENVYGPWPRSGEIDMIEARGNRKLISEWTQNLGCEQTSATLNYGAGLDYVPWWYGRGELNTRADEGFDRDFHIYECIWTPDHIEFKVDNLTILNVVTPPGGFYELGHFTYDTPNPWVNATNPRMAPYDEHFHFLLNVANGGAYFFSNTNPPPPWGKETPFLDFFNAREEWLPTWTEERQAMAIDYIRVYAV